MSKEPIFIKDWATIFTVLGTGIAILAVTTSMFLWTRSEANADRRELFAVIEKNRAELQAAMDKSKFELQSSLDNECKEIKSAVDKAISYCHAQVDIMKHDNIALRERIVACEIASSFDNVEKKEISAHFNK